MSNPVDRDINFMMSEWGTNRLVTDYGSLEELNSRIVQNNDYNPSFSSGMKEKFEIQNELHSQIRNDEDYDDWEYGTEPIIFK
jgi:hypothetical protein